MAFSWRRKPSSTDAAATAFVQAAAAVIAVNSVSRVDPSLPDRAAEYVRGNAGPGVLDALGRAHTGVWMSQWGDHERSVRRDLYRLLESAPADMGLRWAQVVATFRHWGLTLAPIAGDDWLELLLDDIGKCFNWGARPNPEPLPVTYAGIERIIIAGGGQPGELLTAAFSYADRSTVGGISRAYAGNFGVARALLCALPDYQSAVAAHSTTLAEAALHPGKAAPLIVQLLTALDDDGLAPFAPAIAEFLTGANTSLALATEPLATRCPEPELTTALRSCALQGATTQQLRALRALWKYGGSDRNRMWTMQFVETATSAAAKALAREWADLPTEMGSTPSGSEPPRGSGTPGEWQITLTPALSAALEMLLADLNRAIDSAIVEYANSPWAKDLRRFDKKDLAKLSALLNDAGPPHDARLPKGQRSRYQTIGIGSSATQSITRLIDSSSVTAETMLTVFAFFDALRYPAGDRGLTWDAAQALNAIARRDDDLTLVRMRELITQMGLPGNDLVFDQYDLLSAGLPDSSIAGFVAANQQRFAQLLSEPANYHSDGSQPYRAFATLPAIPDDVADTIFRVALGSSSRNRVAAQDALARHPHRGARLRTALRDPDADTREVAAAWLGRSGSADDIADLESAYHVERIDRVAQAQLDALAALGKPPSTYLNRETLVAAAAKGMRKGPAAVVSWIDWDQLPPVRWAGTDEAVDIAVLQWLLSSAGKLKSPEPTVTLRYYCALFDAADAQSLGDYLLDLWISVDHAGKFAGKKVSAINAKGILAICASTCGENAAPMAEHEIRGRCGHAAAQCRALLRMLSWIDQPNAIGLILSIATRFRTKGIQTEAQTQVEALAARRGWTSTELADRTVPDAGFGDDGRLILDYGPREFSARIGDDLKLSLHGPDGAKIKSLPAPRVSDDQTRVAEAKKYLAGARKAVKTLVPQQVQRLQEAMYAQRSWAVADWEQYLHRHAIVTILCRRLIWAELTPDGELAQTFRPLDDGTLTDAEDNEVHLGVSTSITLVRPGLLSGEADAAWQTHLTDYEVEPLFTQFGERYELAADQHTSPELITFQGHLIEAFTLRSMARKLGYTRGETGDGGVFADYVKTYPSLGLTARLRFSGNQLPEENTTVALTAMSYQRIADGRGVPLRDVPVLLLGAGHSDMAAVAAAGSGFDPEWRRKVAFA